MNVQERFDCQRMFIMKSPVKVVPFLAFVKNPYIHELLHGLYGFKSSLIERVCVKFPPNQVTPCTDCEKDPHFQL